MNKSPNIKGVNTEETVAFLYEHVYFYMSVLPQCGVWIPSAVCPVHRLTNTVLNSPLAFDTSLITCLITERTLKCSNAWLSVKNKVAYLCTLNYPCVCVGWNI